MLPRLGASKLVTDWIVITLAASIFTFIEGGRLANWMALVPSKVFHGQVWRLVTWPLIESGPMSLVLTCLAIFKFGGELAVPWGDRRLLRFMLEIVIGAGIITCSLAAVVGGSHLHRLGGWAVMDILVIAWARQFPARSLVLYGMVTLRGRDLVAFTLGLAILFALYFNPLVMAPELAACALAAGYPRVLLRR